MNSSFLFFGAVVATAAIGCTTQSASNRQGEAGRANWSTPAHSPSVDLAQSKADAGPTVGNIEQVATFDGPMPTGVTVSHQGRIFVNFPRWGDPVEFTVAEIKNGKPVPYPDAQTSRFDPGHPDTTLVGVQSVVVDHENRLWILDTGTINMGPVLPTGAKLVGVDLATNKIFKTISFPAQVALPNSYLNDVRFNLRMGKAGIAFITDSSDKGPNGIIVVDLQSGESWRRLNDHPSTKAEKGFVPTVEGQPLMARPPGQPPQPLTMGSDGIAISADGNTLYYRPLISHRFYSVDAQALADRSKSDASVAATVRDLGDLGFASDGLETDSTGRIYLTDYENNAIHVRDTSGAYRIVARDPRMLWPDTLSVATDGYLYFNCNQLERQARLHDGKDLRQKPYVMLRIRIDSGPVK